MMKCCSYYHFLSRYPDIHMFALRCRPCQALRNLNLEKKKILRGDSHVLSLICVQENGYPFQEKQVCQFHLYTFHSLFITPCSTFRLIKAFIKKVFLSMSHSLHTAYAHHFECFGKNIQNGGHEQCKGYVTLKEKLS